METESDERMVGKREMRSGTNLLHSFLDFCKIKKER